jgi:hypothetical protein
VKKGKIMHGTGRTGDNDEQGIQNTNHEDNNIVSKSQMVKIRSKPGCVEHGKELRNANP